MINVMVRFIEKCSRKQLLVFSLALVTVIGFFDHWSGPEISSSIFYLLPISVSACCPYPQMSVLVIYRDFLPEVPDLIKRADEWMYSVKKTGKNNIVYGYDDAFHCREV